MRGARTALATSLLLATACIGQIGDRPGGGDTGGLGEDKAALCEDAPADVGHAPLRRLTRLEYQNTVRDLLGGGASLTVEIPSDTPTAGFAANNNSFVSGDQLSAYMDAAVELAAQVVDAGLSSLPHIDLDCDPAEADCLEGFIEQFGRLAFRRPLADDEVERYRALYLGSEATWGASVAQELVLQAFLQSPYFLYLPEVGREPGQLVELTSWELASRLSYFLWKTMPDDALLDAAATDALDSPGGLESEVRRMLTDERAQETIKSFHAQWLRIADLGDVAKDPELFPDWSPVLGAALRDETLRLAVEVIWSEEGDGRLQTLLSTTRSFADPELEAFYGKAADADGVIEHDPSERAGILTHASVMAALAHGNDTSWTLRGKFLREQVLCDPISPPPPNVDMSVLNNPDRLIDASCKSCHLLMDPIGAGFEYFDAIGRYRAELPELPEGPLTPFRIEPGGKKLDVLGEFDDPASLARRLSESRSAADCVATKWYTFATLRAPEAEDECAVARLQQRFAESSFDLRELIVAIASSETFRLQRPEATDE